MQFLYFFIKGFTTETPTAEINPSKKSNISGAWLCSVRMFEFSQYFMIFYSSTSFIFFLDMTLWFSLFWLKLFDFRIEIGGGTIRDSKFFSS